ncbi:MAG: hypothetical protein GF311_08240 [Candidatus Lokiarchaeota archaeon]|nr:hypothetical protein [Candidatus Lokiarchaeota archaeon]
MNIRKIRLIEMIISVYILIFILTYFILPNFASIHDPLDVDYIESGKYEGDFLITSVSHNVKIVSEQGEIKWETNKNGIFAHDSDLLPNGNVLIADTTQNRVIEIDIDDPSKIVWSWDALNENDINWTKFGQEKLGKDLSYLKDRYTPVVWTHLNDVDFINGTNFGREYNSILISLNRFNMVLEVNYSETKEILWWYGDPENPHILRHQHNPDRYENGNTVICDSGNNRIIEVNTSTQEIVWELSLTFPYGKFRNVRDCDEIEGDRRLITDSENNRLLVYDINSKTFIKEIRSPWFLNPYEADLLKDGRIIAGNAMGGPLVILDYESGDTIGIIGFPLNHIFPISLLIGFWIFNSIILVKNIRESDRKGFNKLLEYKIYKRLVYIVISLIILVFINYVVMFLYRFQFKG